MCLEIYREDLRDLQWKRYMQRSKSILNTVFQSVPLSPFPRSTRRIFGQIYNENQEPRFQPFNIPNNSHCKARTCASGYLLSYWKQANLRMSTTHQTAHMKKLVGKDKWCPEKDESNMTSYHIYHQNVTLSSQLCMSKNSTAIQSCFKEQKLTRVLCQCIDPAPWDLHTYANIHSLINKERSKLVVKCLEHGAEELKLREIDPRSW